MVFEKGWLFSIGNGAEIRPLQMGRKSSVDICRYNNSVSYEEQHKTMEFLT